MASCSPGYHEATDMMPSLYVACDNAKTTASLSVEAPETWEEELKSNITAQECSNSQATRSNMAHLNLNFSSVCEHRQIVHWSAVPGTQGDAVSDCNEGSV